jgi:hypothetical protein
MLSATIKLTSKLAPHSSPPIGVVLEGPRQLYDREFYKELAMLSRLRTALLSAASGSLAWTSSVGFFLSVRSGESVNRRRKSKKPLVQVNSTLSRASHHCFDIPHIFVTEETKSPWNPIRRRERVQIHRNACTNVPSSTHASMTLEDSDRLETAADDDQYEDILEESDDVWEPGDSEYHAMLVVEEEVDDTLCDLETEGEGASRNEQEVGDDDDISERSILEAHCGDGPSYLCVAGPSSPWTTPSPTSAVFFCPPTPVLMHESASYEDALFSELCAITRVEIHDDGVSDEPKKVSALHRM